MAVIRAKYLWGGSFFLSFVSKRRTRPEESETIVNMLGMCSAERSMNTNKHGRKNRCAENETPIPAFNVIRHKF